MCGFVSQVTLAQPRSEAETEAAGVRVFCGIYTMQKNHDTNVKATRANWAKRCDGFLAFSTDADDGLNAVKIEHEGDEAYDNMWQKSRSIWKYIATHLADSFDYFLLGGDDMFYVVDNLRLFLASQQVETESPSFAFLANGAFPTPDPDAPGRAGGSVHRPRFPASRLRGVQQRRRGLRA